MIITDRFVFIHYPKTGGLFIADVLKKVHQKRNRFFKRPFFQELMLPNLKRIHGADVYNEHGTYEQIPEEHRKKPIISCIRNPFDHYVSLYEYQNWVRRRRRPEELEQIKEQFPAFPNLTFKEYLSFLNFYDLKSRVYHELLHVDVGVITYSFIQFFFKDPRRVIENLNENYLNSNQYLGDMPEIRFLRTETLNDDLYQILFDFDYCPKDISFILDEKKVNVTPKRKNKNWIQYYDQELFDYVKQKERFILKLFPEYDREIPTSVGRTSKRVMNSKKCIFILGMHRSGTSAFAGTLSLLGINFGNHLMPPAFDNEKGYFENLNIYNTNETILSLLASSWDGLFPLPQDWWRDSSLNIYKKEIMDIIKEEFNDNEIFAIKDPRISRLFPLWQSILDDLDIESHFIIPVRNPLEVAISLEKRNNFSLEKGIILWTIYNLDAEHYTRNYSRVILSYDELLIKPLDVIKTISDKLKINFPPNVQIAFDGLNNFLEPILKHHNVKPAFEDERFLDYVFKLHQSLLDLSGGHSDKMPSACQTMDSLACEFNAMRNFFYTAELQHEARNTLMLRKTLDMSQQNLREAERRYLEKENQLQRIIHNMQNSLSWRLTSPLRSAKAYFKKIIG